jgi:hypothetical protein
MCLGGCRINLGPKVSKKLLTDTKCACEQYTSLRKTSAHCSRPTIFLDFRRRNTWPRSTPATTWTANAPGGVESVSRARWVLSSTITLPSCIVERIAVATLSIPDWVDIAKRSARIGEKCAISAREILCHMGKITFLPDTSSASKPLSSSCGHSFLKKAWLSTTTPYRERARPCSVVRRRLSPSWRFS